MAAQSRAVPALGPEAESPGIRPRSCNACHQRKIRCNRKQPCLSCSRRGVPCVYPPREKSSRRARAATVAEIARRISGLETTIVAAADGRLSSDATRITHSGFREDVLVLDESSSRYFDEAILSNIIKLEQGVRTSLSVSESEPTLLTASSPFLPIAIISEPSPIQLVVSLHPTKSAAVRLWTNYVNNIEPYIKLLHVPTDEVIVYATINNPHLAKSENLALCFAIYFVSVAVPGAADSQSQEERGLSLRRFKKGLEQALAHGNLLERPTTMLLKALGIYLIGLRLHNHGRCVWTLYGLAIRAAQSIGLHRDGKNLGLSPFEIEMRRRLWWHFIVHDGRGGEDYGLQSTFSPNLLAETEPPRNLDDGDLCRDMRVLPAGREAWTPMIVQLIGIEFSRTRHRLAQIATSTNPDAPNEELRVRAIGDMKTRLGRLLQPCVPVVPAQRLALRMSSLIIRKLDFITRQQWLALQRPDRWLSESFATEEDLFEAVEILDMGMSIGQDELLRSFRWLTIAYPQYHLTLYVLSHLCMRPAIPNVERAWTAVEEMMQQVRHRQAEYGLLPSSCWKVLLTLHAKAVSSRENRRDGNSPATEAQYICPPEDGIFSAGSDDWLQFLDWDAMVQEFQSDSSGIMGFL